MKQPVPKLTLFVSMENYLVSLVIWKYRACWNQLFWCLYSEHLFFPLVPHKNLRILYPLICLSKIILKMSFALTLHKITLCFLFFNLCNVNPSVFIITELWNSKNIILENFIVFSLNRNGIKAVVLLNSTFLIVSKFFAEGLEFGTNLDLIDGKENLFRVFWIGVWSAEGVIEFEKRFGNHFDSGRSRESTEISLYDREDWFH